MQMAVLYIVLYKNYYVLIIMADVSTSQNINYLYWIFCVLQGVPHTVNVVK